LENEPDELVFLSKGLEQLARAVSRAVVDDDNFFFGRAEINCQNLVQNLGDGLDLVLARDDDRKLPRFYHYLP